MLRPVDHEYQPRPLPTRTREIWQAISCHRSQPPGYRALKELPAEHHKNLWGTQTYYRAFSLANGGREVERDLFAGLR